MTKLYEINPTTMVDEFDVDHSKFSLRDEIEYNFKRAKERSKQEINNYLTPAEVYTSSDWGEKTAQQLNNYLDNYHEYPGTTRTGILAPTKDMLRNYQDLRKTGLVGADNFFHCKANYEAAKRGLWGQTVGKAISTGRELWGIASGDPLADVRKDWHANQRGWNGARNGLSLRQSCPTNPKSYVNPDDYEDIY